MQKIGDEFKTILTFTSEYGKLLQFNVLNQVFHRILDNHKLVKL